MIYGKLEAIDAWDMLMPTGDVRRDLVNPIMEGKKDRETHLNDVSLFIYNNMIKRKKFFKEVGLYGKPKYYQEGDWHYPTGKPLLKLDLDGVDKDICPSMIKKRIQKFLNMGLEKDLYETLTSLGYEVRYATDSEDKKLKLDLLLKIDGDVYGVAVFRSDIQTAVYKLRYLKNQGGTRAYFQVPSNRNTATDREAVKQWIRDIKENKHQFILVDGFWKYVA